MQCPRGGVDEELLKRGVEEKVLKRGGFGAVLRTMFWKRTCLGGGVGEQAWRRSCGGGSFGGGSVNAFVLHGGLSFMDHGEGRCSFMNDGDVFVHE